MKGTKFQIKVWNYLKSIQRGKIKTYKQVAIGIKSPKAARAVAEASVEAKEKAAIRKRGTRRARCFIRTGE